MEYVLQLQDVCKEYKDVMAVSHAGFGVPSHTIMGLLGPNGAGKTSIIRIITGITRADSGHVWLMGKNALEIENPSIGYMPEERGLYKKMKVGEQLVYLTRLRGFSKQDAFRKVIHWMKKFEIEAWWNKKVEELSKGMSQKVQFIATVVHDPALIILDEPFSGLDPINSNLIKDEIIQLRNKGASILFSTHRMEQVEEMCDEIVLINKGKIILNGKVADIREDFKEHKYEIIARQEISGAPSQMFSDVFVRTPRHVVVKLREGYSTNDLLQHFIQRNVELLSFREVLPTFNEIFIRTVNYDNHE